MQDRLTDDTRRHVHAYLADVKAAKNETGKREAFMALLGRLYPDSDVIGSVSRGAERRVRVDLGNGKSRGGRIDTYHGNAIIEFEKNLARTGKHAQDQLREYAAGVWNEEDTDRRRPLLAVATDGTRWQSFRPVASDTNGDRLTPGHVELTPLQDFELKSRGPGDAPADFYFWLNALLFREQQVAPTAETFALDFGVGSALWADGRARLHRAWNDCRDRREPATAFDAWGRYLRYTYATDIGDEAREDLFLRHTYLVSLARLLAWAALSGGKSDADESLIRGVLGGSWFRARGLLNVVDDDFFGWTQASDLGVTDTLAPLWERAMATLRTYDLARLGQDVLKDVYEQLVNPAERHGLGEYYTPDWLCEAVVHETLPTDRVAPTLDPSCGSGGFLRAAIAHYRKHAACDSPADELRAIRDNVVGIDVHPLAVTVARVTYLLELRDLIADRSTGDLQIPVYLADALFLPAEVTQAELFTAGGVTRGYELRFGPRGHTPGAKPGTDAEGGDRKLIVPAAMIGNPRLFDRGIEAAATIATEIVAGSEGETQADLRSYLKLRCPDLLDHADANQMVAALWQFTSDLADLIRREQDGIWAYVVRNAYRPAMLRGHFEFVVGNPPWLSYRYIADAAYQDEVRHRALVQYKLLPTDKRSLFTQMELATVFLAHCLQQFGKEDARLAFVMPRAVLTADQHAALRERNYNADAVIESYWDLMDVRPLFNVPSCVLFARRAKPQWRADGYTLPAAEWKGTLPQRNVPWTTAEPHVTRTDKIGRLAFLGNRNALTTGPGTTKRAKPSVYLQRFAQGATLVPRNLYFVSVPDLPPGEPAEPDGLYRAFTDPEQARTAKQPWKEITMQGRVEGRYLFAAPLAKHLLPFVMLPPPPAVLPYERGQQSAKMLTPRDMRREGYRYTASWMAEAEKHWEKHRPSSASSSTAADWLDYHGKLTAQRFKPNDWLVMTNKSGTNISVCHLQASSMALPLIVDYTLYAMAAKSEAEAAYLSAVLNSDFVDKAIKPFQSTGLLGERDIVRKPLELPIPSYDGSIASHAALSSLGRRAASEAAGLPQRDDFPTGLARRRRFVRDELKAVRREIDALARELLSA